MAAWWVNADQVSKTAPTGEYLTTGGFMIRGQKNFLPPSQLLLGFACYWLISEESRANHGKHRLMRTESMLSGEAEALDADARGLTIEDSDEEQNDGEQDDEEHEAIPDVEDVGDAGEEEIEEDNEAANGDTENDDDDDNDQDHSDNEQERRFNPLQLQGHARQGKNKPADEQPEQEVEIDQTEAQQSGLDTHHLETKSDVAHEDHPNNEDDESEEEESDTPDTADTSQTPSTVTSTPQTSKPTTQNSSKPKTSQPKRGANTKAAKRRAAKYALQDEEDKALAMELLGTTKAQQRKQAEDEAKAAREVKLNADKERRKAQHQKAADAEKARQERLERQRAKGNDGTAIADDDDDGEHGDAAERAEQERREHMNLDLLVPHPEPGDELIAAIPVVAPWTALGRCKYKVKLQPGNLKKGKAVKEIVGTWTGLASRGPKVVDETNNDKDRVWAREIELMKSWRVEEIVGVVPVKGVRIVQGGGLAGQNASAGGAGKGKGGGGARGGKGSKKTR